MRTLLGLAALTAAAAYLSAPAGAQEREKAGESKLEGGYTIVSGEENGKPVPAERIKGATVRFTGDTILGADKDKKEFFAAKYTLDTSKTPWAIKMRSTVPKEADAVGLVKKDGDTVTIIYALPGGKPPTDFKTGDNQNLFVMRSLKKGGKEPGKSPPDK